MGSFDFIVHNPVIALFARPDEGLPGSYHYEVARRTLKRGMKKWEIRKLDAARVSTIFHEVQSALLSCALSGTALRQFDRKTLDQSVDILLRGIQA